MAGLEIAKMRRDVEWMRAQFKDGDPQRSHQIDRPTITLLHLLCSSCTQHISNR